MQVGEAYVVGRQNEEEVPQALWGRFTLGQDDQVLCTSLESLQQWFLCYVLLSAGGAKGYENLLRQAAPHAK